MFQCESAKRRFARADKWLRMIVRAGGNAWNRLRPRKYGKTVDRLRFPAFTLSSVLAAILPVRVIASRSRSERASHRGSAAERIADRDSAVGRREGKLVSPRHPVRRSAIVRRFTRQLEHRYSDTRISRRTAPYSAYILSSFSNQGPPFRFPVRGRVLNGSLIRKYVGVFTMIAGSIISP